MLIEDLWYMHMHMVRLGPACVRFAQYVFTREVLSVVPAAKLPFPHPLCFPFTSCRFPSFLRLQRYSIHLEAEEPCRVQFW